ncbi:hypothetical protein vseg_015653 [Gypsophila vaccaria]
MEGNKIGARMYNTNMFGLEMNIQPQKPQQKHSQIMGFTQQQQQQQQQTQLSIKPPNYSNYNNNSDGDEPNCSNEHDNSNSNSNNNSKSNKNVVMSPWQRMKWTDNMVRVLIMAVYYIGDEAGESDKKGLQKKGKWKSVSRAMMEKGFYVSPQQCEDKFNDLNKRYKRVNDLLGKGTACKVVENNSLLEGMDLTPKLKEEVRKLLNSKHLFFREMCAYHNTCGAVTAAAPAAGHAAAVTAPPSQQQQQLLQQQKQQVLLLSPCLHSGRMQDEDEDEEEEEEDDEEEEDEEENEEEEGNARKKCKTMKGEWWWWWSSTLSNWSGEVKRVLEDRSKSRWEKKKWVMTQMVELEENGVKIQGEALELEKERLKWMKFCSKKEREMVKMRIENDKKRLENEKMLLLLRKKEIEFTFTDQQSYPSVKSCNN